MEAEERMAKPVGVDHVAGKAASTTASEKDETQKENHKMKGKEKAASLFGDDELDVFVDTDDATEDEFRGPRKLVNPSVASRQKLTNDIHYQLSENQGEVRSCLSPTIPFAQCLPLDLYV
jgi:hypothetical protein